MNKKFVQLEPKFILDEKWNPSGEISSLIRSEEDNLAIKGDIEIEIPKGEEKRVGHRTLSKEEQLMKLIRSIRIEVAEEAITEKIGSDEKHDYFKSVLGMNIILPKGRIKELRFHITLMAERNVVAIDGFPKDVIEEKYIIGGKIKVGINETFEFIPIIGKVVKKLLDIELNPWEFKLGNLKKVNIDFSGGSTSKPEWYFKENGIKNDLRVALTIKKPKDIGNVEAVAKAAWIYDPGIFKEIKLGSDTKTVKIC
ncbi:MAG: hypothetical protein AYK22_04775 [Thermoplasmatales archaeon SG8-52-3]|nr:MAG: hypothetical protein AYK22_04775 [Thermoplasmatales archaeon SG8-52-3]